MTPWKVSVHVVSDGSHVALRNNRLLVIRDNEVVQSVPLMRLGRVVLSGAVNVSGRAVVELLDRGIPLVYLQGTGRPRGRLEPASSLDADDRFRQLVACRDPLRRLGIARAVVEGKIANQRVLLARRLRSAGVEDREGLLDRLSELGVRASGADSISQLLGFEGAASAAYVGAWRWLLPEWVGFERRDRTGGDVVNALWNYCSALLRERVHSAVAVEGLDPRLSFLHEPFRGRPTLVFDLMEEWRPVLADSVVLSLIGLGAVDGNDVDTAAGGLLSLRARRAAIDRFEDRLGSSYSPAGESTTHTFDHLIRRQVVVFRLALRDPDGPYQPFQWR